MVNNLFLLIFIKSTNTHIKLKRFNANMKLKSFIKKLKIYYLEEDEIDDNR